MPIAPAGPAASSTAPARADRRRWRVAAVVSAAAFVAALDLFIVNVAFPALAEDFDGAGVSTLSWVLNGSGTGAFALGGAWWLVLAGPDPAYLGRFLPGMVLAGVGVGLTQPALFAAAAALPPARAATGSGLLSTARQLGSALGVAALVALLGGEAAPADLAAFDRGWAFMVAASLAAAGACAALGRRAGAPAAPVPALDPDVGAGLVGFDRGRS